MFLFSCAYVWGGHQMEGTTCDRKFSCGVCELKGENKLMLKGKWVHCYDIRITKLNLYRLRTVQ